jgi:2-aminoadipate transaminase
MVEMLEKYMPKRFDLSWTKPEGGLFLWISLPKYINTEEMLPKAIAEKVAYVVGSAFYFDEPEHSSMRINFSYSSKEQIEEGVKRLAKVIASEIDAHASGRAARRRRRNLMRTYPRRGSDRRPPVDPSPSKV